MCSVISCLCGTCLDSREAHHVPTLCFACGARFDRGAPLALVLMDVGRAGATFTPTYDVDFRGSWDLDLRARVRATLGL